LKISSKNPSIVLTKSEAEKIFGSEDPIEKVLSNEGEDLKVTTIIEDVPPNSTIQFHQTGCAQHVGPNVERQTNGRFYLCFILKRPSDCVVSMQYQSRFFAKLESFFLMLVGETTHFDPCDFCSVSFGISD
jgi:hypothetical protein